MKRKVSRVEAKIIMLSAREYRRKQLTIEQQMAAATVLVEECPTPSVKEETPKKPLLFRYLVRLFKFK